MCTDEALTADALREHAQTCERIAEQYEARPQTQKTKDARQRWLDRAARCRALLQKLAGTRS